MQKLDETEYEMLCLDLKYLEYISSAGLRTILSLKKKQKDLAVRIKRPSFNIKTVLRICANGSSEMVVNISIAIVGMLFNYQMMRYAGENGVAAYGVVQAVTLVFLAVFEGYSAGIIPVVGYQLGDNNIVEMRSLLKKSLMVLTIANILFFGLTEAFAKVFAGLFVSYSRELMDLSVRGFRI